MADAALGWAITALILAVIASFVVYLIAVARLPNERPRVPTYDRLGRVIGRYENPGEQIAPGREGDSRAQHKGRGLP